MPQTRRDDKGTKHHTDTTPANEQLLSKKPDAALLVLLYYIHLTSDGEHGLNPHIESGPSSERTDNPGTVSHWEKFKKIAPTTQLDTKHKFRTQALYAAKLALKFDEEGKLLIQQCICDVLSTIHYINSKLVSCLLQALYHRELLISA